MNPETELDEAALEDLEREVAELRVQLERANHEYYVRDNPSLSDDEYDLRMRRLVAIETSHPELITPDSPTQRVGAPLTDDFDKIAHRLPMLSLQDVRGESELMDWEKRLRRHLHLPDDEIIEYVCEPKIDGLSMAVHYENGRYMRGVTRGDGAVGEDVSANVRTIRAIPPTLHLEPAPHYLEARGEVFMFRSAFDALNEKQAADGKPLFANPRNAGAGSVRQKDPRVTATRPLSFFAYSLGAYDGVNVSTQLELLQLLQNAGFRVNPLAKSCRGMDEVRAFIKQFETKRVSLDYATDGVVVKVNSFVLQNELGFVGRNPRWACAFKFPPDQVVTRVLNIDVNIGRTGALTPMAYFEPVTVAGTTVSRATLSNQDKLREKDVRIGDYVVIHKAGEIIPEVLRSLPERRDGTEREFEFPSACPSCETPTVRPEGEAVVRCPNDECPARLKRLMEHFVGRDMMNIDRVGERLVHTLVDIGMVKDPADLFALSKEQLLSVERLAEKSAQNVLDSIQNAKTPTLARLLFALGIDNVGARTGELIAERFGSLSSLQTASEEEIASIHEVGKVAGKSVRSWLDNPRNQLTLEKLRQAGVVPQAIEKREADPRFAGKSFVFTGSLTMDRREAESLIKERGARASGSVSKNTSFVVAGEDAGSKLVRARELGVRVLSENEFELLLRGELPDDVAALGDDAATSGVKPKKSRKKAVSEDVQLEIAQLELEAAPEIVSVSEPEPKP